MTWRPVQHETPETREPVRVMWRTPDGRTGEDIACFILGDWEHPEDELFSLYYEVTHWRPIAVSHHDSSPHKK